MHSGQRTEATNDTFNLFFSGFHNLRATISHLSVEHGLNATGNTLVWSGGSAGGVGVFTSLDWVADALPGVRVVGAPVGGMPPEIHWSTVNGSVPPSADVRTPAFASNNALFDSFLPTRCVAAVSAAQAYTCGVPHLSYAHLATPTFVLESLTDVVIMCGFEGMPCKPVARALLDHDVCERFAQYGRNASAMLTASVMRSSRDGLFAPSCLLHTGFTLDGPVIDGMNAVSATWQWMANATGPRHHIDKCRDNRFGGYYPPCGKKCPPITKP